jgi:hypothetical protein
VLVEKLVPVAKEPIKRPFKRVLPERRVEVDTGVRELKFRPDTGVVEKKEVKPTPLPIPGQVTDVPEVILPTPVTTPTMKPGELPKGELIKEDIPIRELKKQRISLTQAARELDEAIKTISGGALQTELLTGVVAEAEEAGQFFAKTVPQFIMESSKVTAPEIVKPGIVAARLAAQQVGLIPKPKEAVIVEEAIGKAWARPTLETPTERAGYALATIKDIGLLVSGKFIAETLQQAKLMEQLASPLITTQITPTAPGKAFVKTKITDPSNLVTVRTQAITKVAEPEIPVGFTYRVGEQVGEITPPSIGFFRGIAKIEAPTGTELKIIEGATRAVGDVKIIREGFYDIPFERVAGEAAVLTPTGVETRLFKRAKVKDVKAPFGFVGEVGDVPEIGVVLPTAEAPPITAKGFEEAFELPKPVKPTRFTPTQQLQALKQRVARGVPTGLEAGIPTAGLDIYEKAAAKTVEELTKQAGKIGEAVGVVTGVTEAAKVEALTKTAPEFDVKQYDGFMETIEAAPPGKVIPVPKPKTPEFKLKRIISQELKMVREQPIRVKDRPTIKRKPRVELKQEISVKTRVDEGVIRDVISPGKPIAKLKTPVKTLIEPIEKLKQPIAVEAPARAIAPPTTFITPPPSKPLIPAAPFLPTKRDKMATLLTGRKVKKVKPKYKPSIAAIVFGITKKDKKIKEKKLTGLEIRPVITKGKKPKRVKIKLKDLVSV